MMRLRRLRLRAITNKAPFGADLTFDSGLNIIRAGNTSGKSTCLQAIVFALGMERSLGPQLSIPLPYAMRERIQETETAAYQSVLESYVELEIENGQGDVVTIHRDVVGGADTKLIRTWNAPRLSAPTRTGRERDFFVHDGGAAQREDGFHNFLAGFLQWDLPEVTRFDGLDSPLYLETIFPMLFVEQKRGWSSIQGPFPTFFRIQDIARRVLEFLLDLDAGSIRRERTELRRDLAVVEQRWLAKMTELKGRAGYTARFAGVPESPNAEFAHSPVIDIEIFHDGGWEHARVVEALLKERLSVLEGTPVPETEEAAPEAEQELRGLIAQMDEVSALLETLRQDFTSQSQEQRAIERRLASLEVDLVRNQDAQKLKKLGSQLGSLVADERCPTCHQEVATELMPVSANISMAVEENVLFLRSQIELYRSTLTGLEKDLEQTRQSYHARTAQLRAVRHRIRELRQALVQPSESPSRARIEEIVRTQAQYQEILSMQQAVDEMTDDFRSLATEWARIRSRLRELEGVDLSQDDQAKVKDFGDTVRRHLDRYGFRSFHTDEVQLSDDNFRPLVRTWDDEGRPVEKEVGFEVSASDAIRLKWAYYLALLSLSTRNATNHPGFVIFDEPGQQEVDQQSLVAFLKWNATKVAHPQQVILSTSEQLDVVSEAIKGTPANLLNFDGFILKRLD